MDCIKLRRRTHAETTIAGDARMRRPWLREFRRIIMPKYHSLRYYHAISFGPKWCRRHRQPTSLQSPAYLPHTSTSCVGLFGRENFGDGQTTKIARWITYRDFRGFVSIVPKPSTNPPNHRQPHSIPRRPPRWHGTTMPALAYLLYIFVLAEKPSF